MERVFNAEDGKSISYDFVIKGVNKKAVDAKHN